MFVKKYLISQSWNYNYIFPENSRTSKIAYLRVEMYTFSNIYLEDLFKEAFAHCWWLKKPHQGGNSFSNGHAELEKYKTCQMIDTN